MKILTLKTRISGSIGRIALLIGGLLLLSGAGFAQKGNSQAPLPSGLTIEQLQKQAQEANTTLEEMIQAYQIKKGSATIVPNIPPAPPRNEIGEKVVDPCPSVFYDGFESGSHLPTWQEYPASSYTASVTMSDPAVGSYSVLHHEYGYSGHYQGLKKTFPPAQPEEISWWVQVLESSYAEGYFVIGDEYTSIGPDPQTFRNNGILFVYYSGGGLIFAQDNIPDLSVSATLNAWNFLRSKI